MLSKLQRISLLICAFYTFSMSVVPWNSYAIDVDTIPPNEGLSTEAPASEDPKILENHYTTQAEESNTPPYTDLEPEMVTAIQEAISDPKKVFEKYRHLYPDLTKFEAVEGLKKQKLAKIAAILQQKYPESVPVLEKFMNRPLDPSEELSSASQEIELTPLEKSISFIEMVWANWPPPWIQKAAQNQFNLPKAYLRSHDTEGFDEYLLAFGSIFHAMKDISYEYLKERGISHVTLYRGVALPEKINEGFYAHQMAPLSSFTLSHDVARRFGIDSFSDDEEIYPYLLVKHCPIEQILSFYPTGIVTPGEYEFVVSASKSGLDTCYIIPLRKTVFFNNIIPDGGNHRKYHKHHKYHKWIDTHKPKKQLSKRISQSNNHQDKPVVQECVPIISNADDSAQPEHTSWFARVCSFIVDLAKTIYSILQDIIKRIL